MAYTMAFAIAYPTLLTMVRITIIDELVTTATLIDRLVVKITLIDPQASQARDLSNRHLPYHCLFYYLACALMHEVCVRSKGAQKQSTVRKKMAAVHFTTIPCEPN